MVKCIEHSLYNTSLFKKKPPECDVQYLLGLRWKKKKSESICCGYKKIIIITARGHQCIFQHALSRSTPLSVVIKNFRRPPYGFYVTITFTEKLNENNSVNVIKINDFNDCTHIMFLSILLRVWIDIFSLRV